MFNSGDLVLCIDSKPLSGASPTGLKAGTEYTVLAVGACHCGTRLQVNVEGVNWKDLRLMCTVCGQTDTFRGYFAWRFIKAPPRQEEVESEHHKETVT